MNKERMNNLVDAIEALVMLILVAGFIWAGIGIAEGVINVWTVSVMAVSVILGTAILIDMNWR